MSVRDVMIVGAGPAGLAAAIAAQHAGLSYTVVEKGVLVNSIYHFPAHMVFFTTPELLEIGDLPFVSPFEKPTRIEALRYYRRVVDRYKLQIEFETTVERIERTAGPGGELFSVALRTEAGRRTEQARAVILAIGYFDHTNRLGVPGEDLPHVSHYFTQPHPFFRKNVVVVGGGNSAAEAALELYRAGAKVTLVHRQPAMSEGVKYWVLPDVMNRIKEGSIAARFTSRIAEILPKDVVLEGDGGRETIPADAVFLLIGYHPDFDLLTTAGAQLDPKSCAPIHDPETFETNVRNLFLAGGVMAGKGLAPIFIENGRFHGPKVVEEIARRLKK